MLQVLFSECCGFLFCVVYVYVNNSDDELMIYIKLLIYTSTLHIWKSCNLVIRTVCELLPSLSPQLIQHFAVTLE